jgi:hypothetical protein
MSYDDLPKTNITITDVTNQIQQMVVHGNYKIVANTAMNEEREDVDCNTWLAKMKKLLLMRNYCKLTFLLNTHCPSSSDKNIYFDSCRTIRGNNRGRNCFPFPAYLSSSTVFIGVRVARFLSSVL